MADTLQGAVVTTQRYDNSILIDNANYFFDIVNQIGVQLQSNITDNWVENNTAIQDHIALNPLTLNLRGISGEKVYKYDPAEAERLLAQARIEAVKAGNSLITNMLGQLGLSRAADLYNKLAPLAILYPSVSNISQLARNAYDYVESSYNRYSTLVNNFLGKSNPVDSFLGTETNIPSQTRLREIFEQLSALRASRTALVVSTPYSVFSNMYITSLELVQNEENYITDIALNLKKIEFAETKTDKADNNVLAQYCAYGRAQESNNGKAQGVASKSIAAKIMDGDKTIFN